MIMLDDLPFKKTRIDVIRLQSLVHNQLQAQGFRDLLTYARSGCGYANG